MKTKRNKISTVFFYLVIILNIGFLYTLIWDFVVLNSRAVQAVLLAIIDLVFLLQYKVRTDLGRSPFSILLKLYVLMLVVNLIIALINNSTNIVIIASLLILSIVFTLILNISVDVGWNPIKPYIFFSHYMVFASLAIFVMLTFHALSLGGFQIPSDKYELFWGNLQISGSNLYFPLNLVFVIDSSRDIPFFGDYGMFTGLCHEPHLVALFVTPALFFAYGMKVRRYWLMVAYLCFLLMAASVTNMIVLVFCLFLFLEVWNRNTSWHVFFAVLSILLFLLVLTYYVTIIDSLGLDIILSKLDNSNLSNEVSSNILNYMYSPQTVLGSDIFTYAYNKNATDIGMINFLFIVLGQIVYIYGCIKLYVSKNRESALMSIGLIYFFIHGLKIGQMEFQFLFYLFMLYTGHLIWLRNKNNIKLA